MKDLTEQIYDELNAQVVRMLEHSLNQASRIADLERQLAAPSAPAVEQQPVAYSDPVSCQCWPARAGVKQPDGVIPLYAAPQAADTDKVREAILSILPNPPASLDKHESASYCVDFRAGLKAAAELVGSMAAQAPVREVPETWISVEERLPEVRDDSVLALFNHGGIDMVHLQEYFGDITNGYSDDGEQLYTQYYKSAGITHWCAIPAAPVLQEGE